MEEESDLRFPVNLSQIPWKVGHVCARWRAVARAELCLWNRLDITVTGYDDPQKGLPFFLLPFARPWSISLHWDVYPSTVVRSLLQAGSLPLTISRVIFSSLELHRLQKFHLTCIYSETSYDVDVPPELFDFVVDLSLTLVDEIPRDVFRSGPAMVACLRPTLKRYMGSLQKLKIVPGLTYESRDFILENPYIPFHQLTHLDLGDLECEFEEVIQLLRKCVSLRSLVYAFVYDPIERSMIAVKELLPSLRSLELDTDYGRVDDIPIAWNRLIPKDVLALLSITEKASSLEVLEIKLDLNLDDEDNALPMLTLKHLHTLTISHYDSWVFNRFIVPRLRKLRVCRSDFSGYKRKLAIEKKFKDFRTRSGCTACTIEFLDL
ncbi:hypothetical protein H0H92_001435 [Tricholoma furcatifolium]|nr:hypothetical protein H0H92_001435 [Tricholoma furcatifolium]